MQNNKGIHGLNVTEITIHPTDKDTYNASTGRVMVFNNERPQKTLCKILQQI